MPQRRLETKPPTRSSFFKQELMNIYRWKDENFHKQELGRPEKGKADKPKSLVRSLLTTMRHEARTFLEKPDSLGLGEGLLTPHLPAPVSGADLWF